MTSAALKRNDLAGFTPRTLDVARQLADAGDPLASMPMGAITIEAVAGRDTLWIIARRPNKGAITLKTVRDPGPVAITGRATKHGGEWRVAALSGIFRVRLEILSETLLRLTTTLTPATDLLVPFWSRDLYPLGAGDDPRRAIGHVEAAQRGHNTGLCYFCLDKPAFGSVLYLQDLTTLNPYFLATGTKPDGVVGGEWPELGYQPPTSPLGNSPPANPLKKGESVVISDALLAFRDTCGLSETESAVQFVEMLAEIYPHLTRPEPRYKDWIGRAQRTLRDLTRSPESVIEHYGHTYLHPYVEAEYPDSMVQMTVLASIREYEAAFDRTQRFGDRLAAGMPRFFDKKLGCIRRYLQNVGDDKNANAVDSWYLYHPLVNLARLALDGDEQAKRLLLDSIDYAIKAAHHFKYRWPIQYDVSNFRVLVHSRDEKGLGQTDVGGLYAYLMIQLHDLTHEPRFIDEAKAALAALEQIRFELVYQTNLTAWGAVACVRLWRMTGVAAFLNQAHVFAAGFFHNCEMWDSQIDHARHYTNFFGATCLHDAPYMSAYECFESFAAFDEILRASGDALPDPLRMLLLEYRRYTLDRAWYFYPDALPPEAIAKDNIRNGHIDRRLSFPLEDVYGDGQQAGQVGQEIYGCGGALIFAARAFHERKGVPFRIMTEHPATSERTSRGKIILRPLIMSCGLGRVLIFRKGSARLPRLHAESAPDAATLTANRFDVSCREYTPSGSGDLTIAWSARKPASRCQKEISPGMTPKSSSPY